MTVIRKRVAGIVLLREPDGAALLQHRDDKPGLPHANLWVPPGGHCDGDESWDACAAREFLEETGYSSDNWMLWREDVPYSKIVWTIYTYIARDCVRVGSPQLDAGEKITSRLVSFDEFLMLSEDPTFHVGELSRLLLRARFDTNTKKELHALLFG